jgi:predicted pyridoxine 5'-phosphate oxidase superfamily flavin-nucleotide-binding protein
MTTQSTAGTTTGPTAQATVQPVTLAASPWHAGELAMQQSVGMVERMDRPGRLFIRKLMPDQHRDFYAQLPFVVLGSVDAQGDAWATVRAGAPGFLQSPDPADAPRGGGA